jgi:hypothetical protein
MQLAIPFVAGGEEGTRHSLRRGNSKLLVMLWRERPVLCPHRHSRRNLSIIQTLLLRLRPRSAIPQPSRDGSHGPPIDAVQFDALSPTLRSDGFWQENGAFLETTPRRPGLRLTFRWARAG